MKKPVIMTDGNEATASVAHRLSEVIAIYPITPSSGMGEFADEWSAKGKKNLWGDTLTFVQPESEHSAATTCEGFALAGGRVTNFTSGQGLVLMKEVLYTISGKRLPVVFHIGARALTSHSLNVHCGHDDVMSVADCGWGILFGRNAQEACDLAMICRRAAETSDYQEGITDETITEPNRTIYRTVVKKEGNTFNYQKISYTWGGVFFFKNETSITQTTFEQEIKNARATLGMN